MSMIRWLDELGKDDTALAGGKAINLGILLNHDLPVPNGFVITTEAFDSFLDEARIKEKINNFLEKLDLEDYKQLKQTSKNIKDLFLGSGMPTIVSKKIEQAYKRLKEVAVVCRSSSTFEDTERASFAGQHETFVNIANLDEIVNSVKKCWASLYTSRVLAYAKLKGIEIRNAKMAVIVQRMIQPEKSGVMFTTHPPEYANEIVIEANWGYGRSVVSGEVSPDRYTINKASLEITEQEISSKRQQTKLEDGKLILEEVSEDKRKESCLNQSNLDELAKTGLEIEEIFGSPQDIEWAFLNGNLKILQARPTTREVR